MLNVLVISNDSHKMISQYRTSRDTSFTEGGRSEPIKDLGRYDLAFLDLDIHGWRQQLEELRQLMPVVAFSTPHIEAAVEAMRLGASDYLPKPLGSDAVKAVISRHKKTLLGRKYGLDEITGSSAPMQEVYGLIKRAAGSESNVLITGESGTGKELVARAIHRGSSRNDGTFMSINCSAIPDTLLESELFGFEKGAFTGANYTKKGLVELAHDGTLFFDEIGDVSPIFQTKVLRVLQEGEIMRVGGARHIKVDVRIITATNKDLKAASGRGQFREDLYYRLNVINIHLPPLRERMDDVPILVKHLVAKHAAKRKDMAVKGVSQETVKVLMGYSYPGNVRELENIIERAVSFANCPEILPSDLPPWLHGSSGQLSPQTPRLRDALASHEKEIILAAIRESGGNISRAAASLGIFRQQLQRKLKSLNAT